VWKFPGNPSLAALVRITWATSFHGRILEAGAVLSAPKSRVRR
jgi:hypothetical protein